MNTTKYQFTFVGIIAFIIVLGVMAANKKTGGLVVFFLAALILLIVVSNPTNFQSVFFTETQG